MGDLAAASAGAGPNGAVRVDHDDDFAAPPETHSTASGRLSTPRLLALIYAHRSTIIFTNARRLAERLATRLNELHLDGLNRAAEAEGTSPPEGGELVRAHHGSLSREQRLTIEDDLKSGRVRAIVATSSLELGIDMGAVDLVIQVASPPSVAAGMQRIGRAGHQVGEPSVGKIFPRHRGDLVEAAVVAQRMGTGEIEAIRFPRQPLDVLAQQVVAMVAVDDWSVDDLLRVVRRAAPYSGPQRGGVQLGAGPAGGSLPVRGVPRAAAAHRVGPHHRDAAGAPGGGPSGGDQRRHHPRPGPLCGVHHRRVACGRARRGDGLRGPGGRDVPAGGVDVGASPRSPSTGWWSRRRRGSRARCRSGTATVPAGRWSSAEPWERSSGRSATSCRPISSPISCSSMPRQNALRSRLGVARVSRPARRRIQAHTPLERRKPPEPTSAPPRAAAAGELPRPCRSGQRAALPRSAAHRHRRDS